MLRKFIGLTRSFKAWTLAALLAGIGVAMSTPAMAQQGEPTPTELRDLIEGLSTNIDRTWVLVAAMAVFFMQAGFLCFEVGCVRPKSIVSVAMKNIVDWAMVTTIYFTVGFGIMFGLSSSGFFGTGLYFLDGITQGDGSSFPMVFFLFQLAFAATAATIVSGAMSERTSFTSYHLLAGAIGLVIYPVVGYWVWGNFLFTSNEPWLAKLGFIDFAGSTVVHSVGGWVALVGVWYIGPRLGRYDAQGKVRQVHNYSFPFVALGTFILWFGWWGFNGGSELAMDDAVGTIIINTNIAGASAAFAAFWHAMIFQNQRGVYEKFAGGILGGLVAITACCSVVTPVMSIFVGISAGVIHNIVSELLQDKLKLDDPVGAIPVHLACGIWGTLCVALFGQLEAFGGHTRWEQLGVQVIGIAATAVWTCATAYGAFIVLKNTIGLRVSPQEEKEGIKMGKSEEPVEQITPEEESLDEEALKELVA